MDTLNAQQNHPEIVYSICNVDIFKNLFKDFHKEYTLTTFNQLSFMFWLTLILLVAVFGNLLVKGHFLPLVKTIAPAMIISAALRLIFLALHLIETLPSDSSYIFHNINFVFLYFCLVLLGFAIISYVCHDPESIFPNSLYFSAVDVYFLHSFLKIYVLRIIHILIPNVIVPDLMIYLINLLLFLVMINAVIFLISLILNKDDDENVGNTNSKVEYTVDFSQKSTTISCIDTVEDIKNSNFVSDFTISHKNASGTIFDSQEKEVSETDDEASLNIKIQDKSDLISSIESHKPENLRPENIGKNEQIEGNKVDSAAYENDCIDAMQNSEIFDYLTRLIHQ